MYRFPFALCLLTLFLNVLFIDRCQANQPNVIIVLTDDMGKGELGMSGNKIIKTPNIDRFSTDCLRFTNFHVAQSCAPTRAQLMSGRHEFYAGVTHTICDRQMLNSKLTILPQYLKKGGYKTAMFGKWHLGGNSKHPEYMPHKRGFDTALFTGNQLKRFDPGLNHNGNNEQFKGYCVDVLFSEFMKWADNHNSDSAPYLAYIATSAPHVPLAAPKEFTDMYFDAPLSEKQKTYYAMISNIDANFGKLLAWLDGRKQKRRQTIVIFMTDNGHAISGAGGVGHNKYGFQGKNGLYNTNMRGGKAQPWHGGTCVPFFMRWPGVIKRGRDDNTLTSAMDLLPTLAEIAGVPCNDPGIQGTSLLPNILQRQTHIPDKRLLFSHKGRWHSSEFLEDYKYVYVSVFSKRHRLVWNEGQFPQLFDYVSDPQETRNVIRDHPELVAAMKSTYDKWWEGAKQCMTNDLEQIRTGDFVVRSKGGNPAKWREQEQKIRGQQE